MNGTLVYEDYLSLYNRKKIKSFSFKKSQIQPSSIDLSLSEECYEIKTSFLSPDNKVRDKLRKIYSKKITLKTPKIFKKNKTYNVRLNETLNLSARENDNSSSVFLDNLLILYERESYIMAFNKISFISIWASFIPIILLLIINRNKLFKS